MHKQNVAFVRLGRSLGIFSLKCKSTLQRCPKKVTIIISSIFRHVHALNSCTQFMFMQSQFFLAASKPDVAGRGTKRKQAMRKFLHHDHHTSQNDSTQATLSEEAIQKTRKLLYRTAVSRKLQGTELRSTHAQTESSFRQTGAVTWHLLTEMQKHSPKVS